MIPLIGKFEGVRLLNTFYYLISRQEHGIVTVRKIFVLGGGKEGHN